MPHLTLEYSSNLLETRDFAPLLSQLHALLSETAGIDISNCKSRVRAADVFLVADGRDRHAFVHLDIRFLDGRTDDVKRAVGSRSLEVLGEWFAASLSALALQITVEVQDIDRRTYFKHPS